VSVGTPALCLSNGSNYHRFADYSSVQGAKVVTVLSKPFRKFLEKNEKERNFYFRSADINSISPKEVLEALITNGLL
jgi:hypothetical protein